MEKRKTKWIRRLVASILVVILSMQSISALAITGENRRESFGTTRQREGTTATNSNATDSDASDSLVPKEQNQTNNPNVRSLLPLQEVRAYSMIWDSYTEEERRNMPIRTILDSLVDADGTPIEITEDAKLVWIFPRGGYSDSWLSYEEQGNPLLIEQNETIDISTCYDPIEIIVGSGNQLDPGNIRYIVQFISSFDEPSFFFKLYEEKMSGVRKSVGEDFYQKRCTYLDDENIPTLWVSAVLPDYTNDKQYHLGISSIEDNMYMDDRMELYPMKEFLEYYRDGAELDGEITGQIIDQHNLANEGGYGGSFENPFRQAEPTNADNYFCLVARDRITNEINGWLGLIFTIETQAPFDINISRHENNQTKKIMYLGEFLYEDGRFGWWKDIENCFEGNEYVCNVYAPEMYVLAANIDENSIESGVKYYLGIDGPDVKNIVNRQSSMDIGIDSSINSMGYAFELDFSEWDGHGFGNENNAGYQSMTETLSIEIYLDDYCYVDAWAWLYRKKPYGGVEPLEGTKGVSDEGLFFYVNGAAGYNPYTDLFVVENRLERTLDTLYDCGYQTIFLLNENADLSSLKPEFQHTEGARVHVGERQTSGVTEQDFSSGSVYYAVHKDDDSRNYNVIFVKKENEPKLFVNGPKKREIFLVEYYENRHDILIANVGSEELTGLNVELVDAEHVKLDDYWTIGGENNDSLAAFTTVKEDEMANLAKIRLHPDGVGEISGKLKISADGQEDVSIELTGFAGNPRIITETLSDGVKYVPYSYVIATDNMHKWAKVTFDVSGLPEGLSFNEHTGEIYGVPQEIGIFNVYVTANYSREEFEDSTKALTLTIGDRTNVAVYAKTDKGYEIEKHVGIEVAEGSYDFILNGFQEQTFVSAGEYHEFMDFWLNGEKLVAGKDYDSESGSTKITIRSQTFRDKAVEGINTIAAEFRVDGDVNKELKRTAQNFRMEIPKNPSKDESNKNDYVEYDSSSGDTTPSKKQPVAIAPLAISTIPPELFSDDSWIRDEHGWKCMQPNGTWLSYTWCRLPYIGTLEWYCFNAQGYMMTGWIDDNGHRYYLHPHADGSRGRMYKGWNLIDGKWYYFNEMSDGSMGALKTNTWIGEYYVNEHGVWVH